MSGIDSSKPVSISRTQIQSMRGPKGAVDADRPLAVLREWEPACRASTQATTTRLADVTSVFLAGAECSFRCTMCDLWRHTIDIPTPPGALTAQLRLALSEGVSLDEPNRTESGQEIAAGELHSAARASPRWIKLYNSSNFFDPRCVPREDWDDIAACVQGFTRVVVENHPRWIDAKVGDFAARLAGSLEVAIGLETVNEKSMRLLNKQMSLANFQHAAELLQRCGVDLRVFILLQPPGTESHEALHWVEQSLHFAQRCGARHCSVIPTRGGNGMMEALAAQRLFVPPTAESLEKTLAGVLGSQFPMVITADLWDWDRLQGHCGQCREPRKRRLLQMNLTQRVLPTLSIDCACAPDCDL